MSLRCLRSGLRALAGALGAVLLVAGAAVALAHALPLPSRLSLKPSRVVEYADGTVAHVVLAPDERWRVPVRLDAVDPAYVRGLIAIEDQRFFVHPGVDPVAVARAASSNLRTGRRVSGASTLTMQLARILEPSPRTWGAKLKETLRALQLEVRLTKRDILTAYLQFAPFGRNLEGVESAALAYFGHSARHLSPQEIATLLAVPQRPAERYPSARNQVRLARASRRVWDRLLELRAYPGRGAPTLDLAVPARLVPFPREAPHASLWLLASRDEDRVRSTLEAGLQRSAERLVASSRADLALRGIHNGAVVVVEHSTGAVRALVGNLDFFDARRAGQVVAFSVPRSPGSALKPLLYALAIERGIAGPSTLVRDIPAVYGTWSPENFDGGFRGLVRLDEALSHSLNLPFVALLRTLGVESVVEALRGHDVRSLAPAPGHYGLSLAVGGVELTPLELAQVYATLARGGLSRPLRVVRQGSAEPPARRLYSPGAAFLTAEALRLRDRPDFPERRRFTGVPEDVAWKTGTSFGHRDAWTAGFTAEHTVVTWLGNLDNAGSAHLVGASAAAPLFFDVVEVVARLDRQRSAAAAPATPAIRPSDLALVEVCAFSGHAPGEACAERTRAWALRRAVPTEPCPFHQRISLDATTGLRVSPGCRAGRELATRDVVLLPTAVRRFMRERGVAVAEPPPWVSGCAPASDGGLVIGSPRAGQVALLVPGLPPDRQELPLELEAAPGATSVSWFVDGALFATAKATERVWWTPRLGHHDVVAVDEAGQKGRVRFEVRERR